MATHQTAGTGLSPVPPFFTSSLLQLVLLQARLLVSLRSRMLHPRVFAPSASGSWIIASEAPDADFAGTGGLRRVRFSDIVRSSVRCTLPRRPRICRPATGDAPTLIYDSKIADAAYPNQKWPERFRSNKVPILLLDGEKTIPMIPVGMNALRKVLANSSRKTLAGQDHDPETEAIAPVIRQFLQP